jgi:DnaA-homolog protein
MLKTMTQLTLPMGLKDGATFDNFYAGRNEEIVSLLKKSVLGQGENMIYLIGSGGQGCSHLLQACCHHAYSHHIRSVFLSFAEMDVLSPDLLTDLESITLICLDDLHFIAGKRQWEESLFHLYNRVQETGSRILIGAKYLPKAIHLQLADLTSRLSCGVIYKLQALTDKEKLSALIMRANLRGIHLSFEVGKYILTHLPRQMGELFFALDVLDKASLTLKRRLTIPFVKEVLKI